MPYTYPVRSDRYLSDSLFHCSILSIHDNRTSSKKHIRSNIWQNTSSMILLSGNYLISESKSCHHRKNYKNRSRNVKTNQLLSRKNTYNFRQISELYELYKAFFLPCSKIPIFFQNYLLIKQSNLFKQKITGMSPSEFQKIL